MTQTKRCSLCKQNLPLEQFYKHATGKFGRTGRCKPCYMKAQKKCPRVCRTCGKEFLTTKSQVQRSNGYYCSYPCATKARWPTQQPEISIFTKRNVRARASYHIHKKLGEDQRICCNCGSTKNVAAHHPDFNKPLTIAFLCRACHRALHSKVDIPITTIELSEMEA